jgi:hypothetical protein
MNCRKCGRETSWLDIVSSALKNVHGKKMGLQEVVWVNFGDKSSNSRVKNDVSGAARN